MEPTLIMPKIPSSTVESAH
uniref:Uncharacterized protein n=1 Tax=Acrobeloides nanus TaxID=290746 RepID=A0A914DR72_9BILA